MALAAAKSSRESAGGRPPPSSNLWAPTGQTPTAAAQPPSAPTGAAPSQSPGAWQGLWDTTRDFANWFGPAMGRPLASMAQDVGQAAWTGLSEWPVRAIEQGVNLAGPYLPTRLTAAPAPAAQTRALPPGQPQATQRPSVASGGGMASYPTRGPVYWAQDPNTGMFQARTYHPSTAIPAVPPGMAAGAPDYESTTPGGMARERGAPSPGIALIKGSTPMWAYRIGNQYVPGLAGYPMQQGIALSTMFDMAPKPFSPGLTGNPQADAEIIRGANEAAAQEYGQWSNAMMNLLHAGLANLGGLQRAQELAGARMYVGDVRAGAMNPLAGMLGNMAVSGQMPTGDEGAYATSPYVQAPRAPAGGGAPVPAGAGVPAPTAAPLARFRDREAPSRSPTGSAIRRHHRKRWQPRRRGNNTGHPRSCRRSEPPQITTH
jgi:hypothetical protein